jgi:hypothetical protein
MIVGEAAFQLHMAILLLFLLFVARFRIVRLHSFKNNRKKKWLEDNELKKVTKK